MNKFILLLTSLMVNIVYAEESLTLLMQRMKSTSAVKISYQETRHLELMDQPWQGSGYLYSIAPNLMIKEQLQPQRVLMGVKDEQIFYFDLNSGQRYQGEMEENNPLSLNIAIFKALINADEILLKRLYFVEFLSNPQRWVMNLKAKNMHQKGVTLIVSGQLDQPVDTIVIKQADGDLSEFMLQPDAIGAAVKKSIMRLYIELVGK